MFGESLAQIRDVVRGGKSFRVIGSNLAMDNTDSVVVRAGCVFDPSSYAPTDFERAEFFGGGYEFMPFCPSTFGSIRSFGTET